MCTSLRLGGASRPLMIALERRGQAASLLSLEPHRRSDKPKGCS